jgi:aldose 1-epimerase
MTSAITGQQYQIVAGPYRATVTELGAGLRELYFRDQPLIAGYEADELPPGGAGQLLAPEPARVCASVPPPAPVPMMITS